MVGSTSLKPGNIEIKLDTNEDIDENCNNPLDSSERNSFVSNLKLSPNNCCLSDAGH